MAKCCMAVCVVLLGGLGADMAGAAGNLTVLPLFGGGTLGEGGRQPFGESGVDDPLRGLGRQDNPLDAPIQGDLDRYRDDITPMPTLPPQPDLTPYASPRPVMRPGLRPPGLDSRVGPDRLGPGSIWWHP